MDTAATVILLFSVLMLVSIVSSTIGPRLGMPVLLLYLLLGMLIGEDGPGGIQFDDVFSAYLVGSAALAVILFDGGLRTDRRSFRVGLRPALSLATLGVAITAAVTSVAAWWALGIGWLEAALVGAIVGSTDAAAVFSLLRGQGMALRQRVGATLEIESGANDPMAVFLTIVLVQAVAANTAPGAEAVLVFAWQMALGAAAGVLAGIALAWCLTHLRLISGLYPLLVLSGALCVFSVVALLGGSGFLAVYVAGLVLGKRVSRGLYNLEKFLDGIAWLAQILMFLMLGLLVTPSELVPIAVPALLVGLVLIFVARPLAVVVCLAPFRFAWREQVFVGWVGLRGAVPIILALFPWIAGLPDRQLYFNLAFFVVLLSLVLQGWTVAPLARLLGLEVPSRSARLQRVEIGLPGQEAYELVGYSIAVDSEAAACPLAQLSWPGAARPLVALRGAEVLQPDAIDRLRTGDQLYLLARPEDLPALDRLLVGEHAPERLGERRFFGDFTIDAAAPLGALAEVYGFTIDAALHDTSIGTLLHARFPTPVVGDRLQLGDIVFTVREMRDARVVKVGLKRPKAAAPGRLS